jgi:DNA-binding transcriptional regulator YiaG
MSIDEPLRETVERALSTHELAPEEVRRLRDASSASNHGEFAAMVGCSRQHVYNLERDGATGMSAVAIASRVYLECCRRALGFE